MASKISRREAYQFYRSVGYSASEARNMRNRGVDRLIQDYRASMTDYNAKRKEQYEKDFDAPYEKPDKPYKPEIPPTEIYQETRSQHFESLNIPGQFQDEIDSLTENDAFALDLYSERLEKLHDHFVNQGKDWNEIMDDLADLDDLGEFLDALGELYGEEKEN